MPSLTLAMAPSCQFCILSFITWPLPGVPSAVGQVETGGFLLFTCFSGSSPPVCLRLDRTHSACRQPHSWLTWLSGVCLSPTLSPLSPTPPSPAPQPFHSSALPHSIPRGFQTLSWLILVGDATCPEEEPPKATAQNSSEAHRLGTPVRAFPERTSRRPTAVSQGLGSWTD